MKENELIHNFLYSCNYKHKFGTEQLVRENALSLVVSGEIQLTTSTGVQTCRIGDIGLLRRNQLVKALKIPDKNGNAFKSITIFLTQEKLRSYAIENNIKQQDRYSGTGLLLSPNTFLKAYFDSLLPYFDQPGQLTIPLAELKTNEAIELLLMDKAGLRSFLFDFSEPHKIDLESFMIQNYEFNIPLAEFARLTGRSISTFKRDFKKTFPSAPEKWLREKRLERAHYLISEKKQNPSDIYLQVGFENFSHFSKAFKDYYGVNASTLKQ
jgi:AraC-like DNA-binding protein